MIPVEPGPEPDGFDANVRTKGLAWIRAQRRPIASFPAFWRWCEPHLRDVFRGRCGWTAMWISSGHVEHFISQSACLECDQPHLAYDWANYRYIMPELNSRKGARPPLLDPFEVREGWFEIVLPQLHLRVTDRIPDDHREIATATVESLRLANDFKLMRLRREYMQQYRDGKIQLAFLDDHFPLLARALRDLFASHEDVLSDELRAWRSELIAARRAASASVP